MSDLSYTWFAVPVAQLTNRRRRTVVAQAFGITLKQLISCCQRKPATCERGYDNTVRLRLVDGCPCVVHENDDGVGGGTAIEDLFYPAGIGYLRSNNACSEYMASRSASAGDVDSTLITCAQDGISPVIRATWVRGRIQFDLEEISYLDTYYRIREALLGSGPVTTQR